MFVAVDLHGDAEGHDELWVRVADVDIGDNGDGGGAEFITDDLQHRHIEGDLFAQGIISGPADEHSRHFVKNILDAVAP